MRVFLSSYGDFSLAVPIACVSSITLFNKKNENRNARKIIVFNKENNNTYISLPRLLGFPGVLIRHGIILKDGKDDEDSTVIENKNILLTAEIECETDIPQEEIYPLPKTLMRINYSFLFSGLSFNSYNNKAQPETGASGKNLTLLLNPEQLIKRMKRITV